jgi:hypothetical protein
VEGRLAGAAVGVDQQAPTLDDRFQGMRDCK